MYKSILPIRFLSGLLLWLVLVLMVQPAAAKKDPPFITTASARWADSVLTTLSPAEKIGQLIMVAAWSNKDSAHIREITRLINDWHIGGLIFFQGGPVRQANLTNYYQSISKTPLLIGIDGEWGLTMRLDSTLRFPRQMTLSAIQDDSVVYTMGTELARQCKRLGIHINFAPDADINNNPLNPIIGSRSFGDQREQVARKALLYMHALQDHGILASGKHFPGHGNADSDSHLTLPVISQSREGLDTMELYPFKKLIDEGLGSIMVAHLNVPALDSSAGIPSTLSSKVVNGLLKDDLEFKGLVFTDALNMKAVSSNYRPGILDRSAFMAGNDILLYCEDVQKAVEEILAAVDSGLVTQEEVDRRVKKVLMTKYWCGLGQRTVIDTSGLLNDLNSAEGRFLQRNLYERSITLLQNPKGVLPLKDVSDQKIAVVSIGALRENPFQQMLTNHIRTDLYAEEKDASDNVFDALFAFLKNYDMVVLSLHGTTMRAQTGYGIPEPARRFIDTVMKTFPTVFVDFGNAYTLNRFRNLDRAAAVVLAYEDFQVPQEAAAQFIAGALTAEGRLPVNVSTAYVAGSGSSTSTVLRLKYALPEELGIPTQRFQQVDSIAIAAIKAGAMPGCQILVAKEGKIIYEKAFGYQTYDSLQAVRTEDQYDIASVTKIAATALATMKIYESGHFDLNQPLSKYLTPLRTTNKRPLVVRDVLTHQAGLVAWVPFWKYTMTEGDFIRGVYAEISSSDFPFRVCDSMYIRSDYQDSLKQWVYDTPVGERGKYVYSDLGPIMMKWTVEEMTGQSFESYLEDGFYRPLQLHHSGFRPYTSFTTDHLVPTENDTVFRHRLLRGDVHDPAAALQGGISGNAGLFSNAFDLAVIMQMLLKKGWYGGEQLLKPSTVNLFTSRQFPKGKNRRGLLFDKPETEPGKPGPTCNAASPETFGHQGFTGTCVWADPRNQLIFIFLSNRIHPDVSNDKLVKLNVRTALQQAVYDALSPEQSR